MTFSSFLSDDFLLLVIFFALFINYLAKCGHYLKKILLFLHRYSQTAYTLLSNDNNINTEYNDETITYTDAAHPVSYTHLTLPTILLV